MIYTYNLFSGKDNRGNSCRSVNSNSFNNTGFFDIIDKDDRFVKTFGNWYLFGFFSGPWNLANFISKSADERKIILDGCSFFTFYPITRSFGEVTSRYLISNSILHRNISEILSRRGFEVQIRYSVLATFICAIMFICRNSISIFLVLWVYLKYCLSSNSHNVTANENEYFALYKTQTQINNFKKTKFALKFIHIDDKPSSFLVGNATSSKNLISGKALALTFKKILLEVGLKNVLKHDALYPILRIAVYRTTIEKLNLLHPLSRILTSEVLFPFNHANQSNVDMLLMIDLPKGKYFPCDEGIASCFFINESINDSLRSNEVLVHSSAVKIELELSEFVFRKNSRFVGFFVQPILLDEELEIIKDIIELSQQEEKKVKLFLHPRSNERDYSCLMKYVTIGDRTRKSELSKIYTRTSSIGVELETFNFPVYYCLYGTLKDAPMGIGQNAYIISERPKFN